MLLCPHIVASKISPVLESINLYSTGLIIKSLGGLFTSNFNTIISEVSSSKPWLL